MIIKQNNLNIFIENTFSKALSFEEKRYYDDVIKTAVYHINDKEIFEKSCLNIKEKVKTITFDIVLCDDEKIHEINREYRKIDKPTDVITFALFADSEDDEKFIFDGEINLGEILISIDTIEKQAKENNNTFYEELMLITSHGILHLLGFDHMTQEDYDFMVKKQIMYKEAINV